MNDFARSLPIISTLGQDDSMHDGLKELELRFGKVAVGQDVSDGFEVNGSVEARCFVIPNGAPE